MRPRPRSRLLACALWIAPAIASAHDVRPGVLAIHEQPDGTWRVRSTSAEDGGGPGIAVRPRWPRACHASVDVLICPQGLHGPLRFPSLRARRVKALVHIEPLEGPAHQWLLREGQDAIHLGPPTLTAPGQLLSWALGQAPRSLGLMLAWAASVPVRRGLFWVLGAVILGWLPALVAPWLTPLDLPPPPAAGWVAGAAAALFARHHLQTGNALSPGRVLVVWFGLAALAAWSGAFDTPTSPTDPLQLSALLAGLALPWVVATGVVVFVQHQSRHRPLVVACLGSAGAMLAGWTWESAG